MKTESNNGTPHNAPRSDGPPPIEAKAPATLSTLKWAWLHVRHGGAANWAWALLAVAILAGGAVGWSQLQRWISTPEPALQTSSPPAQPSTSSTPPEKKADIDPAAAHDIALKALANAQVLLLKVHFAVQRRPASVMGLEGLAAAMRKYDDETTVYWLGKQVDGKRVENTPEEKRLAEAGVQLASQQVKNALRVIQPEVNNCEIACRTLRELLDRSSKNDGYLGAHHAELGMMQDDIALVLSTITEINNATKDEIGTGGALAIKQMPDAIDRIYDGIGQILAAFPEANIAEHSDTSAPEQPVITPSDKPVTVPNNREPTPSGDHRQPADGHS